MADSPEDTQVSKLVVDRSLATADELRDAVERQKHLSVSGKKPPLSEILIDMGYLTRSQLLRVQGNSDDSGGRPAQQLPGYQLQRRIGAGAMAVVYKARQLSLDRIVAVKVLPKRLSKNAEFVERFYREGRAAAALNHPHIVQAIDVGESGGFHYFVMEFVEGKTVYDELADGSVYEEADAIRIIKQVGLALQHAHDRDIIHRDVKPKNIMLTKDRMAKLADMGLARAVSDVEAAMAEAGRAYGTPYYISPEQVRGEVNIDIRADIYSLGATFYHMVTGRVPFEGPTPSAVMHKHLKEAVTPPDHINTRLSSGCAAMIEKMLAKNREERYANCREMIEDLDRLERGEAPQYTETKLGQDLFRQLSSGQPHYVEPPPRASGGSGALTVFLGVVAALSIFGNLVLLATIAR